MTSDKKIMVGLVQLRSGRSVKPNVEAANELIRQAAAGGASYVLTPENTALMELDTKKVFENTEMEDCNWALQSFISLARELNIWLHIGAMAVKVSPKKVANRSYVISPDGKILLRYDKIHMFDVDLPGGESYRESKYYEPGRRAAVVDLPWGRVGLTICYDLRFPYLYRRLAKSGAEIITVPAAFTKQTGEAHWHILLRARAIETGCYILAPAQGGHHEVERDTFGHSLVISPWGEILAEAGVDPAVIFADIDLNRVKEVRQRIPSLRHDRSVEIETEEKDMILGKAS